MVIDKMNEAEFQLRKLTSRHIEIFEYHQWPIESSRWIELLFCILSKMNLVSVEDDIRRIVTYLDDLDLLSIDDLTQSLNADNEIDYESANIKHIVEVLKEFRFGDSELVRLPDESINKIIRALCQTAFGITTNYSGRLQIFLRKYGFMMMEEISNVIKIDDLNDVDKRNAIIIWLQNVINMPIGTSEEKSVKNFCKTYDLNTQELMELADNLGINVAVIDDLLKKWTASN